MPFLRSEHTVYVISEILGFENTLYVFMHRATQVIRVNDVMTCDLPAQLYRTTPTSAVCQIL